MDRRREPLHSTSRLAIAVAPRPSAWHLHTSSAATCGLRRWRVNPEIFVARKRLTGKGTKGWDHKGYGASDAADENTLARCPFYC
jgi:hypothetical protein